MTRLTRWLFLRALARVLPARLTRGMPPARRAVRRPAVLRLDPVEPREMPGSLFNGASALLFGGAWVDPIAQMAAVVGENALLGPPVIAAAPSLGLPDPIAGTEADGPGFSGRASGDAIEPAGTAAPPPADPWAGMFFPRVDDLEAPAPVVGGGLSLPEPLPAGPGGGGGGDAGGITTQYSPPADPGTAPASFAPSGPSASYSFVSPTAAGTPSPPTPPTPPSQPAGGPSSSSGVSPPTSASSSTTPGTPPPAATSADDEGAVAVSSPASGNASAVPPAPSSASDAQAAGDNVAVSPPPPSLGRSALNATSPPPAPAAMAAPRDSLVLPCGLGQGLTGWVVSESGGAGTGRGTVTTDPNDGDFVLREGNSFRVAVERTFTLGANPGTLTFKLDAVSLDGADAGRANDAFEAELVDADGKPVVPTFANPGETALYPSRVAYFNQTERVGVAAGSGVTAGVDGTVALDVSGVAAGQTVTVRFQLVNNDGDTGSFVRIHACDQPPTVTANLLSDTAPTGPGVDPYRTDRLTNDPRVTGRVTDDHRVKTLEARVGAGAWADITASLQADGTYTFDPGVLPAGPTAVTVRATDWSNAPVEVTTTFAVNAPPVPAVSWTPTAPGEGDSVSFTGAGTADPEGVFSYRWTLADGSTVTGPTAAESFAQDGTYPVTLTVTDTAGSVVAKTATVAVANRPPVVTAPTALTVDVGQGVTLGASFTDPGVLDTHTATFAWADGTTSAGAVAGPGRTVTGSHAFAAPGTYVVTMSVTDDAGATGTAAVTVTVRAVDPHPTVAGPATVAEGAGYVLTLAADTPPGVDEWHIAWGDGATSTVAGTATTANHVYADGPAGYTIVATATNASGSWPANQLAVAVGNVAPTLTPGGSQSGGVGMPLALALGSFTDPGYTFAPAGATETFTATVNWGDGTASHAITPTVANGSAGVLTSGLVAGTHTYATPDTYTVTVTVADDDGGTATATFAVTVTANAPALTGASSPNGVEGSVVAYTATFTDVDPGDAHTATVAWGDGTTSAGAVTYANGTGTVTASHVYADNQAYAVGLTVTDRYGLTATTATTATITNAAPTLTPAAGQSGGVNRPLALTLGSFSDAGFSFPAAGTSETFTATVNWGDGTATQATTASVENGSAGTLTTGSLAGTHAYTSPNTYTVTVTVTDDDGGAVSGTFAVTVTASAPVVTAAANPSGAEGAAVAYTATFTDADPGDTHTATVAWGDGTSSAGAVSYANGVGTVTASHVYADNKAYPVGLAVTDKYGLATSKTTTATIANVAPTATPAGAKTATAGTALSFTSATFTDPGFTFPTAGTSETFTATINWGDGTGTQAVTPTVTNGATGVLTSGSVPGSHTYAAAGTFTVTVVVADDDGGTATVTGTVTVSSPGLGCFPAAPVAITGVSRATSASATGATTDDATLVVSGTGQPGALVTLTRNGTAAGAAVVAADGTWRVDTTGTALAAGSYAFAASQAPLGPLGAAGAFNGFFTQGVSSLSDVQGRLAAGGAITLSGHGIGTNLTAADDRRPTLVAGGALTFSSGQVYHGDIAYAATASLSGVTLQNGGLAFRDAPIDFAAAGTYLTGKSDAWAATAATGTTTYTATNSTWAVALSGSDPAFNVFTVDGAKLGSASSVTITAPAGSTVLVNVTGTAAQMTGFGFTLNGVDKQRVVYNFSQATSLTLQGIGVPGTVVAPRAAVSFSSGNIDGQLVARSVSGSGELHHFPLLSSCPTLTSAAYTVTVQTPAAFVAPRFYVAGPGATGRYTSAGAYLGSSSLAATAGTVTGVAADAAGNGVYTVAANADGTTTVTAYQPDGSVRQVWRAYGVTDARDVAATGNDLWVVGKDATTGAFKAFKFKDGIQARAGGLDPVQSIALSGGNANPTGLATDGWLLFVTDRAASGGRVFVYDGNGGMPGGSQYNPWKLDAANADPTGITLNPNGGSDLWVVDATTRKVYDYSNGRNLQYYNSGGVQAAASTFALAAGTPAPVGIADPPAGRDLAVDPVPAGAAVTAGDAVLVTGSAPGASVVTVGGVAATVDAGGRFFAPVRVAPGRTDLAVVATGAGGGTAAAAVVLDGRTRPAGVDFAALSDVTPSFAFAYGRTSYDPRTQGFYADLTATLAGTYPVGGPAVLVVKNLSDPRVRPLAPDGYTPTGDPYFDLTRLAGTAGLTPGDAAGLTLSFLNPGLGKFTYDLQVLAPVNRSPRFTTAPAVEAIASGAYAYAPGTADPDGDPVTVALTTGPAGMTYDPTTGRLTWTTPSGPGTHLVTLRATDGKGGTAEQAYAVEVKAGVPNRPPQFTTFPAVTASVGSAYSYPSHAADPDGDSLTYTLLGGPSGAGSAVPMAVNATTGAVAWTPGPDQVGTHHVRIKVADGRGGEDVQEYDVVVGPAAGNRPPVIVSTPETHYEIPHATAPVVTGGAVTTTTDPGLGAVRGQVWLDVNANGVRDRDPAALSRLVQLKQPGPNDFVLFRNDDNSSNVIDLGFTFEFYGRNFTRFYLNNNGNVTFDGPLGTYTALGLAGSPYPMLAPFWADVDTEPNDGGVVRMIDGNLPTVQRRTSARGNPVLQIDWDRVGYFSSQTDKLNTFTLYVEDDPAGDVVAFVYGDMQWTTGYASGGSGGFGGSPARTGYTNGAGRFEEFAAVNTPAGAAALAHTMRVFRISPSGEPEDLLEPGIDAFTVDLVDRATGRTVATQVSRSLDLNGDGRINPYTEIGSYRFEGVAPGNYTVRVEPRDGWRFTSPPAVAAADVTVAAGRVAAGTDFGVARTYLYPAEAVDPDGDAVTYRLLGDAHGATVDPSTGRLNWIPAAVGTYVFRVEASDGRGGRDEQAFTVTVTEFDPNFVPVFGTDAPPAQVVRNHGYSYTALATDDNRDPLRYDLLAGPAGMTVDRDTGRVLWTPAADQAGPYTVRVRVRDGRGGEAVKEWSVAVVPDRPNRDPVIAGDLGPDFAVGEAVIDSVEASDPDGDALSFDLVVAPAGMRIQELHGYIVWQPTADQVGDHAVILRVRDSYGGVALKAFTVRVVGPNTPPVILTEGLPGPATAGRPYTAVVSVVDADPGAVLTFSADPAAPLPGWLSLSPSGVLTGTPTTANVTGPGPANGFLVRVRVSDGLATDVAEYRVNVVAAVANAAPTISSEPTGPALAGRPYAYQLVAADPDGDALTFSLDAGPDGVAVGATTGLLSWTPTAAQVTGVGAGHAIAVRVSDGRGAAVVQTFVLRVLAPNAAPAFTTAPPDRATVGAAYTYRAVAIDPDGDPVAYSLDGGIGNMLVDPTTGVFTWTPQPGDAGAVTFTVVASDGRGGTVGQVITLPVVPAAQAVNRAPAFTSTPVGPAAVNRPYAYPVAATDPDGDAMTFALDAGPAGMMIDSITGLLSWTPTAAQATGSGTGYPVVVRVSDGRSGQTTQTFTLRVAAPNAAPVFSSVPPGPATVGVGYVYSAAAADPDGEAVAYTLDPGHPDGMAIDPATGRLTWTAPAGATGAVTFTVRAADPRGASAGQTVTLGVVPAAQAVNHAPVFDSTPPGSAAVGVPYAYDVSAHDPDGEDVTLSLAAGAPPGMAFVPGTARLAWTPDGTGDVTFTVVATDARGLASTQTVTLGVVPAAQAVNRAPAIASTPPGPAVAGRAYTYRVAAADPDGDPVTFTLDAGAPDGMAIDATTGVLAWTPSDRDLGAVTFTVRVSDGRGGAGGQVVTLAVIADAPADPNDLPVIDSRPPGPATVGRPYVYAVTAHDPNGDVLAYALDSGSPVGMAIDAATGRLTWTPGAADAAAGSVSFTVRVADGRGGETTQAVTLGVLPANRPPQLLTAGLPGPARVGTAYAATLAAADPDGDSLSYTVTAGALPDGLALDPATGAITGTPTAAGDVAFTVTVADGRGGTASRAFPLAVVADAPNHAPVFDPVSTASPVVGVPLALTLTARDPDGDVVSYALTSPANLAGYQFDPISGRLTWTPQAAGPASFTVVATDGRGGSATLPVSLAVASAGAANTPPAVPPVSAPPAQVGRAWVLPLGASDPDGDPLTYTLSADAPAGVTVGADGVMHWTPSGSQAGDHPFAVTVSDGRGGAVGIPLVVTVGSTAGPNHAPVPSVSAPGGGVVGRLYSATVSATDADGDPVGFALLSGPRGLAVDPTTGAVRWVPAADQTGPATVSVRAADPRGAGQTITWTVTVRAANAPPVFASTPVVQAAAGTPYGYAARAVDPDGDPLTYALEGAVPAGLAVNPATGVLTWANPVRPPGGQVAVSLAVTDGAGGVDRQSFAIQVATSAIDRPPAFAPVSVPPAVFGTTYALQLRATDPDGQAVTYSLAQPVAGVSIDPARGLLTWANPTARVTVTVVATAGGLSASVRFGIGVRSNAAPAVDPVGTMSVTEGVAVAVDVRSVDPDGDPLGYAVTAGPAGLTVDNLGRVRWDTTGVTPGSYPVTVRVRDPYGAAAVAAFTIVVTADQTAPTVRAVPVADRVDVGGAVIVRVVAADNVGVTARTLEYRLGTGPWAALTLDGDGFGRVPGAAIGAIAFRATAADAAGNVGTGEATVLVVDRSDTNPPSVAITGLADGAQVSVVTPFTIAVTDDGPTTYRVEVVPADGGPAKVLAEGDTPAGGTASMAVDPTILANGPYTVVVTVTDRGGNVTTVSRSVTVENRLKLGNLSLALVDVQVPVAGIPVTVTRMYDTLDAGREGDFGYGWHLELGGYTVTVDPATADPGYGGYPAFVRGTRVAVKRRGDNMTDWYTFDPKPGARVLGLVFYYLPYFRPDPGVENQLIVDEAVQLKEVSDGRYVVQSGDDFDPADLDYNPARFGGAYRVRDPHGMVYTVDAETGDYRRIRDRNGNELTFADDGIFSNRTDASGSPIAVRFERDFRGRIAAVVDPAGKRVTYAYDAAGDLVAATDRTDRTVTMSYHADPAHFLDRIAGADGRAVARTEYEGGRVKRVVNADDTFVEHVYDPAARTETVADELGRRAVRTMDPRGNVVRVVGYLDGTFTEANAAITTTVYNTPDNRVLPGVPDDVVVSRTDPLNRTTKFAYDVRGNLTGATDPLGHRVYVTYNEYGESLTMTDQTGVTSTSVRDGNGNVVTVTDPAGKSFGYDGYVRGLPGRLTDPDGRVATMQYDAAGNVTLRTTFAGQPTSYTYDANNRPLTESTTIATTVGGATVAQVATTTITYDAEGRVTKRQFADGTDAEIGYDLRGRKAWEKDQFDRATRFTYDDRDRLRAVQYPDLSTEAYGYDAAGNRTSVTDRRGFVTTTVYDALNRPTAVVHPDGDADPTNDPRTTTTYDKAGQVTATTDELNRVTTVVYDSAGRRTGTVDPLGHRTTTVYDPAGRVTEAVDQLGRETTREYNSLGFLTRVTAPDGGVTTYAYDAYGQVVAATDPLGRETRYKYNAYGQVTETVFPDATPGTLADNPRSKAEYDSFGRTTASVDERNHRTEYEYDVMGRQVLVRDALGHETTTAYDDRGRVESVTDANGHTTTYQYDAVDRVVQVDRPDGTHATTVYDAAGQVVASVDGAGRRTTYVYDARGRQTGTVYADATPADPSDNPRTTTEYDASDRVVAAVNERGNRTTYTYDGAGRPEAVIDALGHRTTTVYDAAGQVTQAIDALSRATTYQYDPAGRRTVTDRPDGTRTTTAYDLAGQVVAAIDQEGHATTYSYDARGRLTGVEDAEHRRSTYTYDAVGNRTSNTDANGHVTTFVYDALDRLASTVRPLGQSDLVGFTPTGQVAWRRDFNGRLTTYTYDAVDRLQTTQFWDGTTESRTYNGAGQLTTATDPRGAVTYTYDERGRVAVVTDPDLTRVTYAYDAAGNRTGVDSLAGPATYTFDALNRVETVRSTAGMTTFAYDPVGRVTSVSNPNGVTETRTYQPNTDYVARVTNAGSGGTLSDFQYARDKTGRIRSVTESGGRAVTYGYDATYRLTGETTADAGGTRTVSYTLDPAGNRLRAEDSKAGVTTYAYDANDRLLGTTVARLSGGPVVTTYAYDNNGNTLSVAAGADVTTYAWDARDRLVRAEVTAGGVATVGTYTYDFAGNRVGEVVGGIEERWQVDRTGLSQVLAEYAPAGTVVGTFVFAMDRPVTETVGGAVLAPVFDGHSGVRQVADAAGAAVGTLVYDAFGNRQEVTGAAAQTPHGYRGERWDGFLGRSYNRARYYDPGTGRFLGVDPESGDPTTPVSLHRFVYAAADPVNLMDPTGREFSVGGMLGGLSVGGMISSGMATVGARTTYAHAMGVSVGASLGQSIAVNTFIDMLLDTSAIYSDQEIYAVTSLAYAEGFATGYEFGFGRGIWPCQIGTILNVVDAVSAGADDFESAYAKFQGGQVAEALLDAVVGLYDLIDSLKSARACFVAGTLLSTPDGYKRIEEIRVGDQVLSRAEGNPYGGVEAKTVEEVFVRHGVAMVVSVNGRQIGTTTEHPFYSERQGWIAASELQVGDRVWSMEMQWATVTSIEPTGDYVQLYNLRVADWHTYFVGGKDWSLAIWSHNKCTLHTDADIKPYADKYAAAARSSGGELKSWDSVGNLSQEDKKQVRDYIRKNSGDYEGVTIRVRNKNGRNGTPEHQEDVSRNEAANPGLNPRNIGGGLTPDGVGEVGQSLTIRGVKIDPIEGGRVIVESDRTVFNGRYPESPARQQLIEYRQQQPNATLVVTDPDQPGLPPLVYHPGTNIPGPGPISRG